MRTIQRGTRDQTHASVLRFTVRSFLKHQKYHTSNYIPTHKNKSENAQTFPPVRSCSSYNSQLKLHIHTKNHKNKTGSAKKTFRPLSSKNHKNKTGNAKKTFRPLCGPAKTTKTRKHHHHPAPSAADVSQQQRPYFIELTLLVAVEPENRNYLPENLLWSRRHIISCVVCHSQDILA